MSAIASGILPLTGDSASRPMSGVCLVCVSVRSGAYFIVIGDFSDNRFLGITKVFPVQNSFQLTGDLVKSPVNFQVPGSWVIFLVQVPSSRQKHTHLYLPTHTLVNDSSLEILPQYYSPGYFSKYVDRNGPRGISF